jgi:hypothetical protein
MFRTKDLRRRREAAELMERALRKVSGLPRAMLAYREQFERVQKMPGANRVFSRIASAPDQEQLQDYLAEIRYALIFAGLGFHVTVEPLGATGPDLGVARDGHAAIVEVMLFREVYAGPPIFDPDKDLTLQEYGNPARDVRKAAQKLVDKFRQVGAENGIIAVWNDDGDMASDHVRTAVNVLSDDVELKALIPPEALLFVLYGSHWVRAGDRRQLYCFQWRRNPPQYQRAWQSELQAQPVREHIWFALTEQG